MSNKLDPKILVLNMHMVDAILNDCIALGERARIVRAALTGERKHVQLVEDGDGLIGAAEYGVIHFGAQNPSAGAVADRHAVKDWTEDGTL